MDEAYTDDDDTKTGHCVEGGPGRSWGGPGRSWAGPGEFFVGFLGVWGAEKKSRISEEIIL